MRAPEFWRRDGVLPRLLAPAAQLYGIAARRRQRGARPQGVGAPVICVGNLVAGGAGKTPVALSVAGRLIARGAAPHFLTRGHGGSQTGPLRVDPVRHDAAVVGDEALLLAAIAPTWVARDRLAGARAAAAAGASAIVMDDVFQNPALAKDLSLVVVDGAYGFGNGRLIPAGPLREPVADGLARADAGVLMGEDRAGVAERVPAGLAVLRARLAPGPEAEDLRGRAVVAFAGIGRPEKFFGTLAELGCEVLGRHAFADHHRYRDHEVLVLADKAAKLDALLVTTAKDAARLAGDVREMVSVLTVHVAWDDAAALDRLLDKVAGDG